MADTTELPNPFTPIAFLSPVLAIQFEVTRYVLSATLGAYVWDIALNLGNDYTLLFKRRVRLPTIVYFLSRAFTLAFILVGFVDQVASVENCKAMAIGFGICFLLSQTTTAMLFFLRVTAVWHPSQIAYAVFSVLWVAVLGAGITVPLGVRGMHIGPTLQCITTAVRANVAVSVIIPLINDTAIFFAINYRILAYTIVADSPRMARLRVFFGGTGLSALSQALLQSGQHFYLIAVITHVFLLVLLKLPHLSAGYHTITTVPSFALINVMACQVFRRIKFGLISSDGTSKIPTTGPNLRALSLQFRHTDPTTAELGSNATPPSDVQYFCSIKLEARLVSKLYPSFKTVRALCVCCIQIIPLMNIDVPSPPHPVCISSTRSRRTRAPAGRLALPNPHPNLRPSVARPHVRWSRTRAPSARAYSRSRPVLASGSHACGRLTSLDGRSYSWTAADKVVRLRGSGAHHGTRDLLRSSRCQTPADAMRVCGARLAPAGFAVAHSSDSTFPSPYTTDDVSERAVA
ncbi:hypothetical protein MSAN_02307000 [Mycena sanguinolenta]|uniref:Uncharacterized protein n=1 Tax=Mycena sanguinolenta TaxID=230812 RepID=A0A8H7CHA4_9AGAR|nr:hypothetical protein MSAN_02307000 [Mycena sanguinolenta]